jgi:AAA+ superfamily predicted ATPase
MEAELLERLLAAVSAEPGNTALQVRVARSLLEAGRAEEALEHCALVLDRAPGNKEALDLAVQAAGRVRRRPRPPLSSLASLAELLRAWSQPSGPSQQRPAPTPEPDPTVAGGQPAPSPPGPAGAGGWPAPRPSGQRPRAAPGTAGPEPGSRPGGAAALRPIDIHLGEIERPEVTLADVGGMPLVKRRLATGYLAPLRHPELRQLFGRSLRGGLLLYGPPGCGKTFVARVAAGELGASFLAVDLGHVLDMWLGYSEQTLHEIFERARAHAPCVLFIDELDALGRKRAQRRYSVGRNVVAQLIAELHAVGYDAEGVVVMAASAQPWEADVALRQPGRFDHRLLVLPPDHEAREAIVRDRLRGLPIAGLAHEELAARTQGLTAAELIDLCDQALLAAVEAGPADGARRAVTAADFELLLAGLRPIAPAWFAAARDYLRYSGDSAAYDELAAHLRAIRSW